MFYKILSASLIFFLSMITAVQFLKLKKRQGKTPLHSESRELGDALASGIFLGAAFFHMLPDSTQMFENLYGNNSWPIAEWICVLGFLFLLFLERISLSFAPLIKNSVPYFLLTILTIHSLIEGAALGIGQTTADTIMLLIAILAHKSSEIFVLCNTLWRQHFPLQRLFIIAVFFSLMTPFGIFLGDGLHFYFVYRNAILLTAVFNAFAAGTFLYISTLHHLHFHEHAQGTQGLLEFIVLTLGVVIMGIIACWV